MSEIDKQFANHFSHWGIILPSEDVRERQPGRIVAAGWAIWYLFGEDEHGEYLDYYAAHRMTNDRHVRIRVDGSEERLPTVSTMQITSRDPEENARLAREHLLENRRVERMLEEKGFGMTGAEPGLVQVNRFLALGGEDDE